MEAVPVTQGEHVITTVNGKEASPGKNTVWKIYIGNSPEPTVEGKYV